MLSLPTIIPETITPRELAQQLGVSPRKVEDEVRALGCFCKIGRTVLMREHHVETFMEAMEWLSKFKSAARFGTTGEPFPEGDYEELAARRTKRLHKGSQRRRKQQSGAVTLMDRGRT